VPGLWEAQGHLDLDGVAWYRLRFRLDDTDHWWTLRFGAVMDIADVFLNGAHLGHHDAPFTPFELDPGAALVPGQNTLCVRVEDPPVTAPEHLRLAHGKQGWANQWFPSRPSLYMTYGGIWQEVTLRRHGPVTVRDVFVNSDPEDLVVAAEVDNRTAGAVDARLHVRTVGFVREVPVGLPAGSARTVEVRLGPTVAPHWSPERPALHAAMVDVVVDGEPSDAAEVRYGLRTVRIDGTRLLVDGRPYRMRSALVQGFRADELYAEGSRDAIREEVLAAMAMGFNTLRLHIKAFDPTYLEVCDELGMLLHCDIPVAEPVAHEELGEGTLLTERCVRAAREQVRRDRNHPSVILWSAMNELCLDRREARAWPGYEAFVRAVAGTVMEEDPTRPVIENDWDQPDPDRVFTTPLLTAHWYGRLHADYLDEIEARSARWTGIGRPLFITEFGDWGLPAMPSRAERPFWDPRELYVAGLAATAWPGTLAGFLRQTQRHQGLSDRLQGEVFRRHDHLGGYCLTELTDVPHELNGLLDLLRVPKPLAVAEISRLNQAVLPMLHLPSLVLVAGEPFRAPLHVANDGPLLPDVQVEVTTGDASAAVVPVGDLPGHQASRQAMVELTAPDVPGGHDVRLRLQSRGADVAHNRYPVHVVDRPQARVDVRVLGRPGRLPAALERLGANAGERGPTVVPEDALDAAVAAEVRARLERGDTVLVLAQAPGADPHYPVPAQLTRTLTRWGSSVFTYTTDHGGLPSLPRRAVLAAEDATIQATSVLTRLGEAEKPAEPMVMVYKPIPDPLVGAVVASVPAGPGRLIACQFRLADRAATGEPAAAALLGDLLRFAAAPRAGMTRQRTATADGRAMVVYGFQDGRW
jgi:glycosyl hydrolase family 2